MIHYYRYLFVKMKVFNYSELHFFEGTFYKIHTLEFKLEKILGLGIEKPAGKVGKSQRCKILNHLLT